MNFLKRGGAWVIVQFLIFAVWGLAITLTPACDLPGFRWAGIIIVSVGAICLLLSFFAHGKHLTPLLEPNLKLGLKTTGIYAYVRHPMYLGLMLVAFGLPLGLSKAWASPVSIALTLFFNLKARAEERFLQEAYPDYAAYRNRTGRFLPRLAGGNAKSRK